MLGEWEWVSLLGLVDRTKGHLQMLVILCRHWWRLAATIGLFALGWLLDRWQVAASLVAGLNLLSFVLDLAELRKETNKLYVIHLDKMWLAELVQSSLSLSHLSNWCVLAYRDHVAIYSRELNQAIRELPITWEFRAERFSLVGPAKILEPYVLGRYWQSEKSIFNSRKVRLQSLTLDETADSKKIRTVIQRTDYFKTLVTNDITGEKYVERDSGAVVYDGVSFVVREGVLLSLEDSPCSNQIGASTLAFTRDGYALIQCQTHFSAQSPSQLVPSGSGSADERDLKGISNDFRQFIVRAVERELREECGLARREDVRLRTDVIGFYRLMTRGGKPEFVCVTVMDATSSDVPGKLADPYTADIRRVKMPSLEPVDVAERLSAWLEECKAEASFVLKIHLQFLDDYLRTNGDAFRDLVKWTGARESLATQG